MGYEALMSEEEWHRRLREKFEASEMSYQGIADASGVSKSQVGDIIRGTKMPKVSTLFDICSALGVSPVYILTGLQITQDDLHFLDTWSRLRPSARKLVLEFLQGEQD